MVLVYVWYLDVCTYLLVNFDNKLVFN
jgi:hypothetical protein